MNLKLDLISISKEESQKAKQNMIERLIEHLTLERNMMGLYCGWGQPANMITLSARQRVITLTQVIGDGDEYLKKIDKKSVVPENTGEVKE